MRRLLLATEHVPEPSLECSLEEFRKEGHQDTSPVPDPAEDRWAARKADSLVAICEQAGALAGSPEGLVSDPESCQLVVHVDVGVLTGEEPQGRCHLEDGTPISAAVARRLGCDAQVVAITEREGLPIDVGRSRRLFTRPPAQGPACPRRHLPLPRLRGAGPADPPPPPLPLGPGRPPGPA